MTSNNNNNSRPTHGSRTQQSSSFSSPVQHEEIKPLTLPKDYVDEAERVILWLKDNRIKVSSSKIRNLLSLVSDIYNIEHIRTDVEILPESKTALTMMRIRVVYEAGRERDTVGKFVREAKLLEYIKGIGTNREELIRFSHYMEALVAYYRYWIDGREG